MVSLEEWCSSNTESVGISTVQVLVAYPANENSHVGVRKSYKRSKFSALHGCLHQHPSVIALSVKIRK